jgi:hypothetical protein
VIAGIGFQKLTEYDDFVEAAHTQSVIGISFNLVVAGSIVALLAILAGGLPIVFAIIRSAFARKRYGSLFLLTVPILAFIVFLGTTLLLERSWPANAPAPQTHASRGIFLSVFFAAAIASTGAVCFAVARSEISQRILRFAVLPSLLTTLSMALMLVATIIWGLGLRSNAPQLFNSNEGMFGTSTAGSWLKIVIIMAIATVLAAFSLIRGLSARSALRTIAA